MPNVSCSVPGCDSNSYRAGAGQVPNLKFHRIGSAWAKSWIMAIKRYDLLEKPIQNIKHKYICSLHFEECMYASKNLKKNAVPTLNLPTDSNCSMTTPTTSQIDLKWTKNVSTQKANYNQVLNTEVSDDVVIKYEPPESSEMTIEQEQIGYYETAKRICLEDHSVEDSANFLIAKVESMNADDQVEHNFTMNDKHEYSFVKVPSTIPIKAEHVEKDDDGFVVNETLKSNSMEMHVPTSPTTSKRSLKKLMRYTKKNINSSKKMDMKNLVQINKNKKKEARKRFLLGCDLYLSPQLSSIVKAQLNSKGDQFTDDYKMFCFHLFLSSPTTYKFLSQVLCLPSKNDLVKTYFSIDSKMNYEVLAILSDVSNKMSPLDKECVLTVGEMKLKKSIFYDAKADRIFGLHEINGNQTSCVACYAYTVMLRGLTTDWKLLIGFSFTLVNKSNAGYSTWIAELTTQLSKIGYKVRAVCLPVLPLFTQLALNIVDVSKHECYLEIDGKKVYFIFNIRSMLIKARNALMKNTFVMKNRIASWACVRQLYQVDHCKSKRLVPQLKKFHIKPKKRHLKKIRYASEVIDTSVAVALNVYADKKYLKPFFGTIQLINTMSRVFNVLKSDKPVTCSEEEKQLFDKARDLLNSLLMRKKNNVLTREILFKDAISITLDSISRLGDEMQSENLLVKRPKLTLNCMKSFYDVMRELSGHSRRVTCREYLRTYRRCFIFHALRTAEKKDITLTDSATFLAKYEKYVRSKKIYKTTKHKGSKDNMFSMYLNTSEENRFVTACSHMLQKCVEKHACPKLIEYINSSVADLNPGESKIAGLRVPPDHFLIYCTNLENYLEFAFKNFYAGDNIFKNLYRKVKLLYFDKPCECFPVEYLLEMFIKMRINYNNMLYNRKWQQDKVTVCNTIKFIRM